MRSIGSSEFAYEKSKGKLLDLNIESTGVRSMLFTSVVDEHVDDAEDYNAPEGSRQTRQMRLGTSINLDSHITVSVHPSITPCDVMMSNMQKIGCAGAVLGDIERRRSAQYLPNDPDALVAFRIRSVEMFSLFNSMFINADTLISLQIFQSEYHPNSHQRGPAHTSGTKENLSIYGLLQGLACTPQGKLKLRQILLRPSLDLDLIKERQRTISFFLRTSNVEATSGLTKGLRKIKNMATSIALLRKGVDNPGRKVSVSNNVWATLQRFAGYSLQLRETLRGMVGAERIQIISRVCIAFPLYESFISHCSTTGG